MYVTLSRQARRYLLISPAPIGSPDQNLIIRLLISGSLGATVSEQVAESLVSAMQKGTLLEALLPPVARQSATIEKVQFRDDGAEALSLVLDGQLRLSDEQTKQFAAQLKQRLSTQATSPQ